MQDSELRVSDAERNHVGQILQQAVGQGMLSLGEFSERMDTALAARTRGDLNTVVLDLPGIRVVGPHAPRSVHAMIGAGEAVAPTVIRATMSSITRKGEWHVPQALRVENRLSSVALDFTSAVVASPIVEITVDCFCGSIDLIVPEGTTVDLDAIETIAGETTNKVGGTATGSLHLVVHGRVRFGSLTAKYPFGTGLRRLMR